MRLSIIVPLTCLFLAAGAGAAAPQGKDKDKKDDKKKPPALTEVAGRTFEQWVADITSKDRSKGAAAIKTIVMFGPEQAVKALPVIIAELKKHNKPAPIDMSIRVNGPATIVVVLNGLKEPDSKLVADAVDAIVPMLKDPQVIIKYRAMQALVSFGPVANKALPDLIALATNTQFTWELRHAAIIALGTVALDKKGPQQAALNALYAGLKDSASEVRLAAVNSLENLGVHDNPATKAAAEKELDAVSWKDPEPLIRIRAHLSLYDSSDNPSKATIKKNKSRRDAIAKMLVAAGEPHVRIEAMQALGRIGADAAEQVPTLLPFLKDRDPNVQYWAVMALGNIGPGAAAALPLLRPLQRDMSNAEELREAVREAIDLIEGKKKDTPKGGSK